MLWDDEMEVEVDSVHGVLDIAEPKIQEVGGQVFTVEQAELRQYINHIPCGLLKRRLTFNVDLRSGN